VDSRCLPRAVPSCVTLSISAAGHIRHVPVGYVSLKSVPSRGDPSNARFLEPPEFTISHPKQHVNWFSRFCNVETVANRSTHRHPQTTPLHLCSLYTLHIYRIKYAYTKYAYGQRTGINGESTSMVRPTLGSRTAKEQALYSACDAV